MFRKKDFILRAQNSEWICLLPIRHIVVGLFECMCHFPADTFGKYRLRACLRTHCSCSRGIGKAALCVLGEERNYHVLCFPCLSHVICRELIEGNLSCMTKKRSVLFFFFPPKLPKTWDPTFLHQLKSGPPSPQTGPAWPRSAKPTALEARGR